MTYPAFTDDGIQIQTFDEVFAELQLAYQDIYGASINVDQNSPDGQKLGIEAKLSIDLQSFSVALYNAFDPDFALGGDLIRIAKICGITKKPTTPSTAVMTIITDQNLTLPANFTVADQNNQNWICPLDTALTSGSNTVTFYSQEWGNIEAPANTITNIITVVLGIVSANNAADAVPGLPDETDEQFRFRRNLSLENPSFSTVGGLYAKLANLPSVTDLQVYENDTDGYDPTNPVSALMPPHSIWIVIDGGLEASIAQTTAQNKTGGCAMKGDQVTTWIETRTRPNGSTFEVAHTIRYDRPTIVPLYLRLDVHRKISTQPIDIDLIKKNLTTKSYLIGESAQANELYYYVYLSGNNFIATSLEISTDGSTWTDSDISADYAEELQILLGNITVTEI